jgi:hypothetical protein
MTRRKLDLLGVKEVRWIMSGTEPTENYAFFMQKGDEIVN